MKSDHIQLKLKQSFKANTNENHDQLIFNEDLRRTCLIVTQPASEGNSIPIWFEYSRWINFKNVVSENDVGDNYGEFGYCTGPTSKVMILSYNLSGCRKILELVSRKTFCYILKTQYLYRGHPIGINLGSTVRELPTEMINLSLSL